MAYQSGSNLISPHELLNQLRIFCTTNAGFIETKWTTVATEQLILSKAGVYYQFFHTIDSGQNGTGSTEIQYCFGIKMSTGFDTNESPWMQPGTWGETLNNSLNSVVCNGVGSGSILKYHFFYDGSEVVVVLQNSVGWWRCFSFGDVGSKLTTFTGGSYISGMYHYAFRGYQSDSDGHYNFFDKSFNNYAANSYGGGVIRADLDATPQYHHGGYSTYLGTTSTYDPTGGDCSSGGLITYRASDTMPNARYMIDSHLLYYSSNEFNLSAFAFPVNIWVNRTGNRNLLAAKLDSIMVANIKFLEAEQEVTIGADIWVAFPLILKSNSSNVGSGNGVTSHYHGYLVKKVI